MSSVPATLDVAWITYLSYIVNDRSLNKKQLMKTAVWITKKLNLAMPRDAIGLDLADFPEAKGWGTLSFKRRALVRLAFENVQAFSAPPA